MRTAVQHFAHTLAFQYKLDYHGTGEGWLRENLWKEENKSAWTENTVRNKKTMLRRLKRSHGGNSHPISAFIDLDSDVSHQYKPNEFNYRDAVCQRRDGAER